MGREREETRMTLRSTDKLFVMLAKTGSVQLQGPMTLSRQATRETGSELETM